MNDSPFVILRAQDAQDMALVAAFLAQLVREGIAFVCEYTVSGSIKVSLTDF